ncbi:MAG: (d)CMP kinase [Salinivirgaceae bacterium]|jgi:cytidylate kinase|nr:(d)CMP kinase [Salinivirgaceae bacterium]
MTTSEKKITIAIDGHSSCGKSTVAKSLAKLLSYTYIDSGAMYRAVTLFCMKKELMDEDKVFEQEFESLLNSVKIHFSFDTEKQQYLTWLNNELVEDEIRDIEVSERVSIVSQIGFVREKLVQMQQEMGFNGGIVMDGRDIGTVVFPDAELKIFMTASSEVRAQRRFKELNTKGSSVTLEDIIKNIEKRDYIDQTREISPLKQAHDAVLIDNSFLSREEQLNKILDLVNSKFK